jgi:hypothetical protein
VTDTSNAVLDAINWDQKSRILIFYWSFFVTVTGKTRGSTSRLKSRAQQKKGSSKMKMARRHAIRAFREHNLDNNLLCAHRAFNYLQAIVLLVSAVS